jgi:hypothetical protein
LAARTGGIDNEPDDASKPEPEMSFDQPGAGEAELSFATMGADDVALDMDTEFGFITDDELNEESEDDFDDYM